MAIDGPNSTSREAARAIEIVQDVMRRRRNGENIPDAEVLRAHPDLIRQLSEQLHKASAVAMIADEAAGSPWANLLDNLQAESDEEMSSSEEGPSTVGHNVIKKFQESHSQALDLQPPQNQLVRKHPGTLGQNAIEAFQAAKIPGSEHDDVTRITFFEEEVLDSQLLGSTQADSLEEPKEQIQPPTEPSTEPTEKTLEMPGLSSLPPTVRFRPEKRPPMALLKLRDDNQLLGEVFRLKDKSTVIGRTKGDVLIPHDQQVSGRHASITRELHQQRYRWILRDLGSRNGVFMKIHKVRLKDQDLLLIANRLVQFSDPRPARPCQLREISEGTYTGSLILESDYEYWIGRDRKTCGEFLSDGPQLDPVHAHLRDDGHGSWTLTNCETTNGIWISVQEMELVHRAGFQLGEQRFVFELP